MKAWVTKYALTTGILVVDGKVNDSVPSLLSYRDGGYTVYVHNEGKEWHLTPEAALAKAEEMRLKKIAAVKKKLEKLESMTFKATH